MKTCWVCKQIKVFSDFHKGRDICKDCRNERNRKYYRETKEKFAECRKKYYQENKEYYKTKSKETVRKRQEISKTFAEISGKWNSYETDFLINNIDSMTNLQIAIHLKRNEYSIKSKIQYLRKQGVL